MKAPPQDFPVEALIAELASAWSVAVRDLEYLPLGFGAHHWRVKTAEYGGDLFVALHYLVFLPTE